MNIVESNNGNVVGHAQAAASYSTQGADRRQIVGGEHGCGRITQIQQSAHGFKAADNRMIAFLYELVVLQDARPSQALEEGSAPDPRRLQSERTADKSASAVTQG